MEVEGEKDRRGGGVKRARKKNLGFGSRSAKLGTATTPPQHPVFLA